MCIWIVMYSLFYNANGSIQDNKCLFGLWNTVPHNIRFHSKTLHFHKSRQKMLEKMNHHFIIKCKPQNCHTFIYRLKTQSFRTIIYVPLSLKIDKNNSEEFIFEWNASIAFCTSGKIQKDKFLQRYYVFMSVFGAPLKCRFQP